MCGTILHISKNIGNCLEQSELLADEAVRSDLMCEQIPLEQLIFMSLRIVL